MDVWYIVTNSADPDQMEQFDQGLYSLFNSVY